MNGFMHKYSCSTSKIKRRKGSLEWKRQNRCLSQLSVWWYAWLSFQLQNWEEVMLISQCWDVLWALFFFNPACPHLCPPMHENWLLWDYVGCQMALLYYVCFMYLSGPLSFDFIDGEKSAFLVRIIVQLQLKHSSLMSSLFQTSTLCLEWWLGSHQSVPWCLAWK